MLTNIFISTYRILVCLVIALPIAINYLTNGSIIMSFITIPLLCLLLAVVAIYIDKKLLDILNSINFLPISPSVSNKNSHDVSKNISSVSSIY